MFGYENWLQLNGIFIPATSADSQVDRSRIDSSGVYGGSIDGSGRPLGQAHYYDWPAVTASFSAEASIPLLNVLKTMMLNRATPVSFVLNSGMSGTQKISDAWWNNISIQTSEDSAVTATVSFTATERTAFKVNDFSDYWDNQTGSLASDCASFSSTEPLNGDINLLPVPFWNTTVSGFERVRGWSFSISQDVVRFMGCMNYSGSYPKAPYAFGVGMMNAGFKVSTYDETNSAVSPMPSKYSGSAVVSRDNFLLSINNEGFLSMDCELNLVTDPLEGTGTLDGLEFDYQVYNFS